MAHCQSLLQYLEQYLTSEKKYQLTNKTVQSLQYLENFNKNLKILQVCDLALKST